MSAIVFKAAQRGTVRRRVQVPCQVVSEQAFELLADHTFDLSPEGMLVPTDTFVKRGEKLIVSFRAPRSELWFDAEAEVVRNINGHRQADRGKALALRFSYFDNISRAVLGAKLRGFPPPVPTRRVRRDYANSVKRIFELPSFNYASV